MSTISWYVIRVRPVHRLEFTVLHGIVQREHEAMVPFEEKSVRKPGRRIWEHKKFPLYPTYVFIGLQGAWQFPPVKEFINNLAERKGKPPPIMGLIGPTKDRPAVLSAREVSEMRAASVGRATHVNLHQAIMPGTEIVILDGPFAGQAAKVDSVTRKSVKVRLKMFNGMQIVEVSSAALKAA